VDKGVKLIFSRFMARMDWLALKTGNINKGDSGDK